MLTVGSLFSGIGGLEFGLERSGMKTLWQVECDPYARSVLEKHWPDVRRFDDVRGVGAHNLAPVDLICGGFPCQDISNAGKRRGIEGEKSGLWKEYARIVGEVRPRLVLIENVSALRGRGLDVVLSDLAALGYDAEWDCVPASSVGAPFERDRLFVVAFAHSELGQTRLRSHEEHDRQGTVFGASDRGDPETDRTLWMAAEPDVGRVAHGVSARVDRLRCLGNAVVPQVAEHVGRGILARFGQ